MDHSFSSVTIQKKSGKKRTRMNPKSSGISSYVEKENETSDKGRSRESNHEAEVLKSPRVLRSTKVPSVDTLAKKKRRTNTTAAISTEGGTSTDGRILSAISAGADVTVSASQIPLGSCAPGEIRKVGDGNTSLHEDFHQSGNNVVLNTGALNWPSIIQDRQTSTCNGENCFGGQSEEELSPLTTILKAYDKISKKYKQSKTTKLQEVEALFERQKRKEALHVKATSDLLELLKKENIWLKHQMEEAQTDTVARSKLLELENAECRNDLVMVCAKNLELTEEIQSLKASLARDTHTTDKPQDNTAIKSVFQDTDDDHEMPDTQKKDGLLWQGLLESLTKLKLVVDSSFGPSQLTFVHPPTGLKFKLEKTLDENISQYCGGGGELSVEMISLGALKSTAPQWIRDILVFSMKQVHIFFSRISAAIDAAPASLCPGA